MANNKLDWIKFADQNPELLKKYNELCCKLLMLYAPAQEEAYAISCVWEKEMEENNSS